MNRSWLLGSALGFIFVMIALIGGCGQKRLHEVGGMPMEQAIEEANTRADHEALADHYQQEADALMEKAETHEKMAEKYAKTDYPKLGMEGEGERHCRSLARKYREAAEENLALAKMHRQLAEEAPE